MELNILGDFGTAVQKIVEEALSKKDQELSSRETSVAAREKKLEHILSHNQSSGRIQLQVGSVIYHTTADTLLRCPDSYFHGLLNPKFRKDDAPLFIARDGEAFAFILEFLTYGQIYTEIPTNGMFQKLLADAEFYLLDQLQEQLKLMPEHRSSGKTTYCSVGSATAVNNGGCFAWNTPTHVPADSFSVEGDTVIVLQAGLYLIFCQYQNTTSSNGLGSANLDLLVNGTAVARSYHGNSSGYYDGHLLEHVMELAPTSRVQCQYRSNSQGNATGDHLGTRLSLVKLG